MTPPTSDWLVSMLLLFANLTATPPGWLGGISHLAHSIQREPFSFIIDVINTVQFNTVQSPFHPIISQEIHDNTSTKKHNTTQHNLNNNTQ